MQGEKKRSASQVGRQRHFRSLGQGQRWAVRAGRFRRLVRVRSTRPRNGNNRNLWPSRLWKDLASARFSRNFIAVIVRFEANPPHHTLHLVHHHIEKYDKTVAVPRVWVDFIPQRGKIESVFAYVGMSRPNSMLTKTSWQNTAVDGLHSSYNTLSQTPSS